MRVAIVNLTRGGLSGGYVKYLRRMVPRLARHPDVEELDVFVPEPVRQRLRGESWQIRSWSAEDIRRGFRGLKQTVQERRPDVVFIPTASWLHFGATPVVVMVRNMEPLEVPFGGNPLREAVKNLGRRRMARRACRQATRVIAVSRHVGEFLTRRWHVAPDKIGVVYHGVDVPTSAPPPVRPAQLDDPVPPLMFAAGSIRPARGLVDVIDALAQLRKAGSPLIALVAGGVDTGMKAHVRRLAARAGSVGVADRIIWAGQLTEAEMRWCYEFSTAFVMTSRAEACPNVALEAMSHGCACVSVDRPPMPEFFGPAALYYQAGDANGLTRAVMSLMSRPNTQMELKAAAFARARTFDWQATAERTVAELRTAVRS